MPKRRLREQYLKLSQVYYYIILFCITNIISGYCISKYKNNHQYFNIKSWRQFFASWLELEDRSLYPESKFQLDCLSKFLLLVKKLSQVVGCFQETFSLICMYYHTGIAYMKVSSLVATNKKNKIRRLTLFPFPMIPCHELLNWRW